MASSSRLIALLRGVNVGAAKRVAMADLRALVAAAGYDDVVTLLNSGNVVFTGSGTAAAAATRIERDLASGLGVEAAVIGISARDLAAVVAENPLAGVATDPSRLLVAFCRRPADLGRLAELAARDWAPDRLAVGRRAAYLWCADGVLASALAAAAGKALGDRATTRNWTTVLKLAAAAGVA